ncbi:MAG: hypothetical protein JWN68_196 [Nocardioides sp.]|jgi:hypothetical protein|nr:hypothetical protein [Nocardioides sp.]
MVAHAAVSSIDPVNDRLAERASAGSARGTEQTRAASRGGAPRLTVARAKWAQSEPIAWQDLSVP